MISVFKESVAPIQLKDVCQRFINGGHGSNTMKSCVTVLQQGMYENEADKIILALSVIEPLVLNKENVE